MNGHVDVKHGKQLKSSQLNLMVMNDLKSILIFCALFQQY